MVDKKRIPKEVVPRRLRYLDDPTHNIYKTVAILSKRANQINTQLKEELSAKLADFAPASDELEEMTENQEQIEISSYYERLPKPTIIATEEFLNGEIYFRDPHAETEEDDA
jgi:DNA-directed RNA polymerase subunit K/omega